MSKGRRLWQSLVGRDDNGRQLWGHRAKLWSATTSAEDNKGWKKANSYQADLLYTAALVMLCNTKAGVTSIRPWASDIAVTEVTFCHQTSTFMRVKR